LSHLTSVGETPGFRLALSVGLAACLRVVADEAALCDVDPTPVRLVAFNKSPEANWGVPWHQDRVIAVAEHVEVDGYAGWLRKDGFRHCEPPIGLLENMTFARIHLDRCDLDNGAMEVALGSHAHGRVEAGRAGALAKSCRTEICDAEPGDVLFLKALILHRSATAARPNLRRTLRVDYAPRRDLHAQLQWALSEAAI
jgi:hypothetical protein